jgi:hypothetical protein
MVTVAPLSVSSRLCVPAGSASKVKRPRASVIAIRSTSTTRTRTPASGCSCSRDVTTPLNRAVCAGVSGVVGGGSSAEAVTERASTRTSARTGYGDGTSNSSAVSPEPR